MLTLSLAAAGLALGSIAALSGLGVLLTYRMTGVFNLAHGAMAMVAAYVYWQGTQWHVPRAASAAVAVLLVSPAIGVLAYRVAFRDLQRRGAEAAQSLVATLGLFVLLVGGAAVIWGLQARTAPGLVSDAPVGLGGGVTIRRSALVDLAVVVVSAVVLGLLAQRTRTGLQVRAVVDRRDLSELSLVDADRIATLGWALGSAFAGLTGVLLASQLPLTPYRLTLVVLETFAVPVVAGLTSLPLAVAAGLVMGVGASELKQLHVSGRSLATVVETLQANLLVVVLLVALLALPKLRETRDAGTVRALSSRRTGGGVRRWTWPTGTALLALPLLFDATSLHAALQVPALAVVYVSVVVLTGYSGQVSLGTAGYAGLGALVFARLDQSTPQLLAVAAGMAAAALVGLLTGYPAIRRRGLTLALTTFAVGAVVSRFVFDQPTFTSGLLVRRPSLLGLSLSGDRPFYVFEIGCLLGALFLARSLRIGRLGRALVAVRDNEAGARASGVDVPVLKVAVFVISSALAGLGGALLVQTAGSFDAQAFDPVQSSLVWFTTVVVFGADSVAGAVAAAGFVVLLGQLTGVAEAALLPIGLVALLIGRLPGGAAEAASRTVRALRLRPAARAEVRLTPAGEALLARLP